MASDLFVALARSTRDGCSYVGHNTNRPPGDAASPTRVAGRDFAPGECVFLPHFTLPQVRHTLTALAIRRYGDWGYQHGVNEAGVAVGCTPIRTRLGDDARLDGPDLVRLVLERGHSARHAVETLTDLIGRHGTAAHAFLVADHGEAVVVEAGGHHWAMAEIGSVRAVTGACLLRQDWDRISRGLADFAIEHRWWPDDGRKLDFAGAVGADAPGRAGDIRRWGQSTLALELHSGRHDVPSLRRLLGHQADLAQGDLETVASAIIRLSPHEPPVLWLANGGVFVPLLLDADPPPLTPATGDGCDDLQHLLDDHLHEYLSEAAALRRQGRADELRRLSASFLQHAAERVEELAPTRPREEYVPTW